MKKLIIATAISLAAGTAFAQDTVKSLETEAQKVGYAYGLIMGKRMSQDIPEMNIDSFSQGIKDAFQGNPQLLQDSEAQQVIADFQRGMQEKQMAEFQEKSEENKKVGEAFLAANKEKEGVVTLESGLQYKVLKEGRGVQPGSADVVQVHYTGSLINGEVFDSSIARGEPVGFPVNGVIAGWTEALQLMPTGSKWQLFIPSDLAYGRGGNRGIGPNETLIFEVELLDVTTRK